MSPFVITMLVTIFVVLVIAIAVGVYGVKTKPRWSGTGEAFFTSFFVGIFASSFALSFAHLGLSEFFQDPYDFKIPIRSVGASTNVSGSFFLGSGTVDEEAVFYYYRSDNGVLSLKYRYADKTTIVEDENDNPYMLCKGEEYVGMYKSDNPPTFDIYAECSFHVPEGSVVKSYMLTTPQE